MAIYYYFCMQLVNKRAVIPLHSMNLIQMLYGNVQLELLQHCISSWSVKCNKMKSAGFGTHWSSPDHLKYYENGTIQ